MLTPKQTQGLASSRSLVASQRAMDSEDLAIRYSQPGVHLVANHAAFLTVWLDGGDDFGHAELQELAAAMHIMCERVEDDACVVIGVGFDRWRRLAERAGLSTPRDMVDLRSIRNSPPFADTGGDLFLHLKAGSRETCCRLAEEAQAFPFLRRARFSVTIAGARHGGRQYGGKILNGIINAVDPVGLSARALIGNEDIEHRGGCFLIEQRFVHDWAQLGRLSDVEIENLIGRDTKGNLIPDDDDRRHIKTVRVNNEDNYNYRVLGQNLAYGEAGSGREAGVYAANYAKTAVILDKIMTSMLGDKPGFYRSRHLDHSHADQGSAWYVPGAPLLGLPAPHPAASIQMNAFFAVRSDNGRMFYNARDYLHQVGNRLVPEEDQVSDRVVELIGISFSRWHDTWYRKRACPRIGHLSKYLEESEKHILDASIAIRKGWAHKKTLGLMASAPYGQEFDTFRIHPKELIVGVLPDYTLGSGVDVMTYLRDDEREGSFSLGINEFGAAGHNVPLHSRVLERGIGGLLEDVDAGERAAKSKTQREFFASVRLALEGVQDWMGRYEALSRKLREEMAPEQEAEIANLEGVAERLEKLAVHPPSTFLEAAQLVFAVHCCLHLVGECVSIGRLDQLLMPFFDPDASKKKAQQEIIDCFWIKMDEKVLFNRRYMPDRLTYGSGAITYHGGDFPQGAAINQWVQQITIGGLVAEDAEPPRDASNAVTRMCLRASRRLPLNAPCLSLRVHDDTPDGIVKEAAGALLSGGAHPVLLKDKALVQAVKESGDQITTAHARDIVCDGCFEMLVAGRSEFAFSYVPVPDAIEMALNQGRTYYAAGPVHLQGLKVSVSSKPAEDIADFEEFYRIFLDHYELKLVSFYESMLSHYGNIAQYCTSPLLSALIDGCLETGRDLTQGGARYKILAPLMNGISCAINSLWVIEKLVFDKATALTTLPELRMALISNWGRDMKEPFFNAFDAEARKTLSAERFGWLRERSLALPRFGEGDEEVDAFAHRMMADLVKLARETIKKPQIDSLLDDLKKKYSVPGHPFDFVITPGVATFEDYYGLGLGLAASADGRLADAPVASDFSAMISPFDLPPDPMPREIFKGLTSWVDDAINLGLSNGAPADINITEDFPQDVLEDVIKSYARGEIGSNMMTISCADASTLAAAQKRPEAYDLIRLRMGGWSEFFVTMYEHHQEHHKRRPLFTPPEDKNR